ncbi:hypothetical protein K8T06_06340 [bacterium]|nr:hypothetical protein [bacterium]
MKNRKLRLSIAIVILLVFISLIFLLSLFQYSFNDDAFITFRYSRNIIEIRQFVFNRNEYILGTTTPLYAIMGSLVFYLSGYALPIWMAYLGIGFILLQAFVIYLISIEFNLKYAGIASAVALVFSNSGSYRYLTMETNLLCLLELLTVLFFLKKRFGFAMVFIALATLTRYDAILLFIPFTCFYWIETKKVIIPQVIYTVVILVPWFIFSKLYFGSFLPNSFIAKSASSGILEYYTSSSDYFLSQLGQYLSPWIKLIPRQDLAAILILTIYVIGIFVLMKRRNEGILFLIWPLMIRISYSLIGAPVFHWWEIYKILPFSILPLWAGVLYLATSLTSYVKIRPERRNKRILKTAFILLLLLPKPMESIRAAKNLSKEFYYGALSRYYLHAAKFIRYHTFPNSEILINEIGILGFYTDRHIIDGAGLITPNINFHQKTEKPTSLKKIIQIHDPDYIFTLNDNLKINRYEKIGSLHRGYKQFSLFKKKSLAVIENIPTEVDQYIEILLDSMSSKTLFKPIHIHPFILLVLLLITSVFLISRISQTHSLNQADNPVTQAYLKYIAIIITLVFLFFPNLLLDDHTKREKQILQEYKPHYSRGRDVQFTKPMP